MIMQPKHPRESRTEQVQILKNFCLVPGKFPFKFIQFMLGEMPGQ